MTRPREEAKQGSRTRAGRKQGKRGKERKTKGETRHNPYNRQTPHAHKSPTINAKPQPIQTYIRTIKPSKNALRTLNKAYLKGKAGKESGKEGKGREKGTEHTQREGAGAHHLPPSGHHHHPKERATTEAPAPSKFKYILNFAVCCLRKSR